MKMKRYLSLIQTAFISFFLVYAWDSSSSQAGSCEQAILNLNGLARAATENAEFSNSQAHRSLFQAYRTQFLGKQWTGRTLEDVMSIVEKHPELFASKPEVRERILTLEQRNYEPPQSLRDVIKRLKNSAHQFQAQLFQPEANIGFWQRLLLPLQKESLSGLNRQEKKAKQQEHKAQFREYFDQVLTPKDREILTDDSRPYQEKTTIIYRILNRIRNQMIEEGKDVKNISQAMVDLVHTSGFRNPHYISMLKSPNALDQIKGLEQILNERDAIAMKLNFEGHFSELTSSLNVDHPTGSTKNEKFVQVLSDIQKEIQNSPYTIVGNQVLRVRTLSLQESPFSGCLGGTDCATNTYFELALDPNFIYFTLTDTEFTSSGQITVVLGTAYSQKERSSIKIAFVDKIQNVQQMMVLPMLEAIRLSVEELGYRLSLPINVGGFAYGISNMDTIRAYIDSEVNPLFTHQLENFKPHESHYDFYKGYSRAYSEPKLLEFERQEGNFKIEVGETHTRSKIPEDLKIEDLFKEVLSLKDSKKEEDIIQFMSHLRLLTRIEELGLPQDFAETYLRLKIEDRQISFTVRKKALYTLIDLEKMKEKDILRLVTEEFSEKEQIEIVGEMSNWLNSNERYKRRFINKFSYEFLKLHIEEGFQSSFQSIIFDMLSRNLEFKNNVLLKAVDQENKRVMDYLIEDITLEQFGEFSYNTLEVIIPFYMNRMKSLGLELLKTEVHSFKGRVLIVIMPYLTKKQKDWVTFEQFQTTDSYSSKEKEEFAQYYIAPQLNQAQIQSLRRQNLSVLIPYLTNKQKNWITFEQFQTMPWYSSKEKKEELVQYIAPKLNQAEFKV